MASANGRFPRAQRLIQSSDTPSVMALYGTYGLLVTQDGGASWGYVCEAATGTYMGEDPLLEILPGTKLIARTDTALVASQSSWCDFRSIYGNGADSLTDITRDPMQPNAIVALVGSYDKTAGFTSRIVQSTDAGKSWSSPVNVPAANIGQGLSLDLAPSGSGRLYVTGLDSSGKGAIVVSDDHGQHWTAHPVGPANSRSSPYVAAVSSKNQDTVFVRTDGYVEMDGIDTASDSLLVSTDAGATFTPVITRNAKLFGFALSPDETTVLAGYGDPQLPATAVDDSDAGLYKADLAALLADLPHAETHFTKIFSPSITCLRWTPQGLFACTLASETGFEVGRAADASFTTSMPMPFAPLLLLSKLTPLRCGMGTSAYGCYTDPVYGFPGVCGVIGASCDASAPPPGTMTGLFMGTSGATSAAGAPSSAAGAGTSPSAGGAVAAGSGGTTAIGVAPGGAAGAPSTAPGATPTGGGKGASSCGCRAARGPSSAALALAFLSLIAARTRRGKRGN